MAGAESERGLDLDRDAVAVPAPAVVPPMENETPGRNRPQPIEARLHPVAGRDCLERECVCRRCIGRKGDERTHRRLVRWIAGVDVEQPAAAGPDGR